ncbi:hypothetical protein H8L32_08735 [Undibacterium sp. CY18W]|uniref:Uncharacterized protein n=1 Tax=Undibacterium hunanense TaxID=2762292 RepID=A0ABR6ZNW2_9BURK|nr:hypothetical protein [Undibacterium hunanense]
MPGRRPVREQHAPSGEENIVGDHGDVLAVPTNDKEKKPSKVSAWVATVSDDGE